MRTGPVLPPPPAPKRRPARAFRRRPHTSCTPFAAPRANRRPSPGRFHGTRPPGPGSGRTHSPPRRPPPGAAPAHPASPGTDRTPRRRSPAGGAANPPRSGHRTFSAPPRSRPQSDPRDTCTPARRRTGHQTASYGSILRAPASGSGGRIPLPLRQSACTRRRPGRARWRRPRTGRTEPCNANLWPCNAHRILAAHFRTHTNPAGAPATSAAPRPAPRRSAPPDAGMRPRCHQKNAAL